MGKSKPTKSASRRQQLAGRAATAAAARAASSRIPDLELLTEATQLVGDIFGDEANCAKACALLHVAAKKLGFTTAPRPVSVIAEFRATGETQFMGPKATARIPKGSKVTNLLGDKGNNGHLVLICDEPLLLLDPNLRQLNAATPHFDAPSVGLRIKSAHPESGEWVAHLLAVEVRYIDDPSNRVLLRKWALLVRNAEENAEKIVEMLDSGMTAVDIRKRLDPRRFL